MRFGVFAVLGVTPNTEERGQRIFPVGGKMSRV